ncbi:thermonuclease family protein [Polaromonas sp.]|uniref:thermonuclease family protein n=1 Tax=Polaromonas sp. TaxID=1869339 RepID=UPI002D7802CB|nr:thermonuclease family protein [Polaromonas sp.]
MTVGYSLALFSRPFAERSWTRPSRMWIGLILAIGSLVASAGTITGKVVGVTDGDTLTVLDANDQQFKIRLSGIDAPERGQPFGNRAKESLSEMVFNKQVVIEFSKEDRYRRKVGKVQHEGTDVNLEQVKKGMAWHYTAYAKEQAPADREAYASAEAEARAQRRGLWREPIQAAPWEIRRIKAAVREVPERN